jgi:acetyltransferase-like isoleucine patch superfamily enzyme
MADDLPPLPVSPRGVRRALIELDRAAGAARRGSLLARSRLAARRVGAGLRLEVHPTAVVGHHVVIETWHETRSSVVIGEGVRLGDHTWISMRGGHLSIGRGSEVRRGVTINCSGTLEVGEDVLLSTGTHLHCANSVTIGDWTTIAEYSTVVDSRHIRTGRDQPIRHAISVGEVHIGRNVWIGAKATVAADVHIGDQAIVAGGAVVTRDVPAGHLAAGVPASAKRALDADGDGAAPDVGGDPSS